MKCTDLFIIIIFYNNVNINYTPFYFKGKKTKQMMRKSILLDKIMDLRTRTHSLEISQLADAAFNNLKVSR